MVGGGYSGDEELRAVGVGSGVGHGENTGFGVHPAKVLIREFLAVDGLSTGAARHVRIIQNKDFRGGPYLPRVKSPPWSMNCGMTRWKELPA
jgi:hypothetical protein